MKPIYWVNLTTKEIKTLNKDYVVVIPVGAIEAHGNHLPLNTDVSIAEMFANKLARKFNCIIAPSITYGPCETMLKFSGTITITNKVFYLLLCNVIDSIISHGFHKIYLLNGHGGNTEMIESSINSLKKKKRKVKLFFFNWYEQEIVKNLKRSDLTYRGDHADRLETEIALLASPNNVHLDKAIDHLPSWPKNFESLADYSKIMKFGVEGFPSFSTIKNAKRNYANIFRSMICDFKVKYEK